MSALSVRIHFLIMLVTFIVLYCLHLISLSVNIIRFCIPYYISNLESGLFLLLFLKVYTINFILFLDFEAKDIWQETVVLNG